LARPSSLSISTRALDRPPCPIVSSRLVPRRPRPRRKLHRRARPAHPVPPAARLCPPALPYGPPPRETVPGRSARTAAIPKVPPCRLSRGAHQPLAARLREGDLRWTGALAVQPPSQRQGQDHSQYRVDSRARHESVGKPILPDDILEWLFHQAGKSALVLSAAGCSAPTRPESGKCWPSGCAPTLWWARRQGR